MHPNVSWLLVRWKYASLSPNVWHEVYLRHKLLVDAPSHSREMLTNLTLQKKLNVGQYWKNKGNQSVRYVCNCKRVIYLTNCFVLTKLALLSMKIILQLDATSMSVQHTPTTVAHNIHCKHISTSWA